MANRGICMECHEGPKVLPAKGLCGKCYAELFPPHTRRKTRKNRPNNGEYPKKVMIPCYETSDGKEFGNEIDALRHQLDIERNTQRRLQ